MKSFPPTFVSLIPIKHVGFLAVTAAPKATPFSCCQPNLTALVSAGPMAPPPTDSHIDWPTVGGGKSAGTPKSAPQPAKPAAPAPGGPVPQAVAPPASTAAPAANGPGAPAKGPVSLSGQPLSYAKAATPQGGVPAAEKAPPAGGKAPKKESGGEKIVKEPASPTPPANGERRGFHRCRCGFLESCM